MPHWGEAQLEIFIRQDPADNNWYLAYANTDRRIRFAGDLAQQQANIEQLATNSSFGQTEHWSAFFDGQDAGLTAEDVLGGVGRVWYANGQAPVWEAAVGSEETAFTEIVEFGEEFCEILGI